MKSHHGAPRAKPVLPFCFTLLRSKTFVWELRRVIRHVTTRGLCPFGDIPRADPFFTFIHPAIAGWYSARADKTSGFTLIEIIVVIVIIATLAGLAFPRFGPVIREFQSKEAIGVLTAIYGAQKEHELDNDAFATSVNDLAGYIELPATFKNFSPIIDTDISPANASCNSSQPALARMRASSGGYTMYLLESGDIVCTPCPDDVCQKMGYPEF